MSETKVKKKVLIISHDKIGSSMAGPGIRYHYMAEVLSKTKLFDVTVGFFGPSYLPEEGFRCSYEAKHIDAHYFEKGFQNFDVVIAYWLSESMISYCNSQGIFMVFDLYVPGPVEHLTGFLFSGKKAKIEDDFEYNRSLEMYRRFLDNGDLFLFSNRRQLDYWTGYVFGAGQVQLSTYNDRPIYDRFIYAPMGIDTSKPPKHSKDVIKGVVPGIKKTDKVLLWTGGIWNHFDGQVLINAMKRLQAKRPDIKLYFFGTKHPNPDVPEMKESYDTKSLAEKLGLLGKTVFFNNGWVDYSDRFNYLLEADAAVNTHRDSIEAEFSQRTRVLDHFLAGLPTVATQGDYLSDEVIKPCGFGIIIPANDEQALEKAILQILDSKEQSAIKQRIGEARKSFDWGNAMAGLVNHLSSELTKLPRLSTATELYTPGKTRRFAKKVLPVPVKKAIIRTLRIK